MSRPYVLDACCCGGGIGRGLQQAGAYVIGLDINPQPKYAGDEFIQGDALKLLADRRFLAQFDAIHASPPCQADSQATLSQRRHGRQYPQLIGPIRELLQAWGGGPWMMENVPEAPIRPDYILCGCQFGLGIPDRGLQLRRVRHFETSWGGPGLIRPHKHWGYSISICGHGTPAWMRKRTGHVRVADWRTVMEIDWLPREQLTEAVPVPYGRFMGEEMLAQLQKAAA